MIPARPNQIPLDRTTVAAKALMPFAVALVALALLASGASASAAPPAAALAPGAALAPYQAQAPTPRNLTFYMHNNTLAVNLNGVSSPSIFDTLHKFGHNDTTANLGHVRQDWYLSPTLAGPLAVNGTISAHVFVSVMGATLQVTPTLTVFEINATGGVTQVVSQPMGAQTWWTTPHDLTMTTAPIQHTFAAGSTIEVLVDVVVGASDLVTLWYNATWVPTHVVIQSDSFAQVGSLAFLDSNGTAHVNFDPLALDKTITIQATVTDPLGGYDIAWVNLTLQQPGGAVVLSAVPMAKTSGTPVSFASTYAYAWNYSGKPVGQYNATVGVLDNSGLYYFQQNYATGPFLAQFEAFFYIGGLPIYVNVQAVDSKSAPLAGATVTLTSGNVAVLARTTDANGMSNFTMAKGQYTFEVAWEGVQVASVAFTASANVSAASPMSLACAVYYPTFQAQDASGGALQGASLLFTTPGGAKIGPYATNAAGDVNLTQVPVGTYGVLASWRGVPVYAGNQSVSGNGVISFETAVYELTVTVKAQDGTPLSGAFVSVLDATGLVFDAGYTNAQGSVVLRLPAGTYTIEYRYVATVDGTSYDSGTQTSGVTLSSSQTVTETVSGFPIPFTSTLEFTFILAYVVTVAVLLAVLFLMYRRMKGGKPAAAAEPEPKA